MSTETSRRRGLLFFAGFVILAQLGLFIFLKLRDKPTDEQASNTAAGQVPATEPEPAPLTPPAPKASTPPPVPAPEPAPTPQGNTPAAEDATAEPTPTPGEDKSSEPSPTPRLTPRQQRERDLRERQRHEREAKEARERAARLEQIEKERARAEAERDRARMEADREKARLEAEKVASEKARLEAERKRLELEKAQLETAKNEPPPILTTTPPKPVQPAGSPEVLVILINPSAGGSSLSRDEIRNIYFGRTNLWPNGRSTRAFNRPASSAAGRKFFGIVLRTSSSSFREHWSSLQMSGSGIAPSTIGSADSMIARVAGTAGAIGYVLESELPADLKGLRIIRLR